MADRYTYRNERTSIHTILRDQRELELNPIRTATEKATMLAEQATAEFQSDLVQGQIQDMRTKRLREEEEAKNAKVQEAIKTYRNSSDASKQALAEEIADQHARHLLADIDWIKL